MTGRAQTAATVAVCLTSAPDEARRHTTLCLKNVPHCIVDVFTLTDL